MPQTDELADREPDLVVRHVPDLLAPDAATTRVLTRIREVGGRAFLVGGCVRDALLAPEAAPKDVDVEVFGVELEALQEALRGLGWVDVVGAHLPVLKVHVDGTDLDVVLPPTGAGTPASVEHLRAAAAHRDFTVNALMLDPVAGDVLDFWGGLEDLEAGVLRHTSDHFAEDPLRVLRGAQLAARLDFVMAPETVALCSRLVDAYPGLPRERVWQEWLKIATRGTRPSAALTVLTETGWERHHRELAVLHGVEQDPRWHPEGDVHVHSGLAADEAARLATQEGLDDDDRAVVVLAALLHDVGKATHTQRRVQQDGTVRITSHGHDVAGVDPATRFLRDVGAPSWLRRQVAPLVREHMCATGTASPSAAAVRRLARRLAPASMQQWALVCAADKGGRGAGSVEPGTGRWLERYAQERQRMTPLLLGRHLIEAGLEPGPWFTPLLAQGLRAQDEGRFDDVEGARRWLREHLAVEDPSSSRYSGRL